jgi:hypothetical protein
MDHRRHQQARECIAALDRAPLLKHSSGDSLSSAKSGRKSKVLIAAPTSRKVHIVTPSNSHPKIRRQYTDLQLTAADYLI